MPKLGRFKASDFKDMKHDPVNTKGFMKEEYDEFNVPGLFTVTSGVEIPKNDRLIRYVVLCYAKDSPLVKIIKDIKARKHEAALMVDFLPSEETSAILNGEDRDLIRIMSGYCRMIDDMLWTLRISAENAFYMLIEQANSSVKDAGGIQTYLKCIEGAEQLKIKIEGYDQVLLGFGKEVHSQILKNERQQAKTTWEDLILEEDEEEK